MKTIKLTAPGGVHNLTLAEMPEPRPARGEVLVRIHASSLNYHDYAVVSGWTKPADGRIPMPDGAGVVVELGDGVSGFKPGDHVVSAFYPDWQDGHATPENIAFMPGDTADGYAREYVCIPAAAFTKAPPGYSHAESATLTCAGLTAWSGLVVKCGVKPGDTVLIQGSGGVSIFALQFAKAAGASVIATSSSDEKLERLRKLGASHTINYKQFPEWGLKVKELTDGRGADHIIEIGGSGTLSQSILACRMNGNIALIGILAGMSGEISVPAVFLSQLKLHGVNVGSRANQNDMIKAIAASGIKPFIDSTYQLADIGAAFRHFESRNHFGKVCLDF